MDGSGGDSNTPGGGRSAFEQEASRQKVGFVRELVDFLLHNKKWWMIPIVVVLVVVGVLVMLGGTAVAPFIYTLF